MPHSVVVIPNYVVNFTMITKLPEMDLPNSIRKFLGDIPLDKIVDLPLAKTA